MIDPQLIQRTQEFLFAEEEDMKAAGLNSRQRERIIRLRSLYVYWTRHPRLSDMEILSEARRLGAGERLAYDDVRMLKICIGNINSMTKEWYQYLFIQRAEEAFDLARKKGDPKAFAAALSALGKYTRLDHDELSTPDYSQIVPQELVFTDDPSAVGYKKIPNVVTYIKKLEKKFLGEFRRAEEAEVLAINPQDENILVQQN